MQHIAAVDQHQDFVPQEKSLAPVMSNQAPMLDLRAMDHLCKKLPGIEELVKKFATMSVKTLQSFLTGKIKSSKEE